MVWKELLEKNGGPLMVLAPMADVTDPAFRRIIAKYGKPDVLWTEFVSADGLFLSPVREYCDKFLNNEISKDELTSLSNGVGGSTLIKDLAFTESERPIVVQFFTSKPEMMEKAARLAVELGFDGIDINMGCPDKSIEKQGAGAAHIKNPKLAQEIILAAKHGAGDLPVSVKTRIGYNKNELETWLPMILETNPAVITIHARIRKEMSLVPARWEHVKRAVEIKNDFVDSNGNKSETLIFGNGDALSLEDAEHKAKETGCDGVMLGRAIFGNPWRFNRKIKKEDLSKEEILKVLLEHTKLYEKLLPHKSFAIMKKHFKAYVAGWDGAKELRVRLMETQNASEVEGIINEYL
jgi:tRNA-dihydrouridine synthase